VKNLVLFVALLLAPCLYAQTGLTLEGPGGHGQGEFSPGAGFSALFLIPDFETPRLANLAENSGSYDADAGQAEKTASLPLWLKDLRRAEIVAFGSFPLSIFWTSFFMDLYRTSSHNWDNRYAPWPFKGAGAVGMTDGEIKTMFTIAISSSLAIAVVDHVILRYRRSKAGGADSEKPVRLDKTPVIIPEG
jgi:hypothetical protein